MIVLRLSACMAAWALLLAPAYSAPTRASETVDALVSKIERLIPRTAREFTDDRVRAIEELSAEVEAAHVELGDFSPDATVAEILDRTRQSLEAKKRLDDVLQAVYSLRGDFAAITPHDVRRNHARNFLRIAGQIGDLSGRIRFAQMDSFSAAAGQLARNPDALRTLTDLMIEFRSSVGAAVLARRLGGPPGAPSSIDEELQMRIVRLIGMTGSNSLLAELTAVLQQNRSPQLSLAAALAIRDVGLPQNRHPDEPPEAIPPPITPAPFAALLARIDAERLNADEREQLRALKEWADRMAREGIGDDDAYRVGEMVIKPGDWLLMRNPSPYNLFTDISPGLFTHVGVATIQKGSDGVRRMVIVDLPEQGANIPASNVEVFLRRTLNYVFLRHPDPKIAAGIASAAETTIGAETQFDLTFRTDRVLTYKDRPLKGQRIHTYCAGYLLLCTLHTGAPREEFFPIPESVAPGNTAENLAKLGLSVGEDFCSPSGALFSPVLKLVGRHESMYDPKREVEEAIFDHFAMRLADSTLNPSPDWFQSLRLKLAEASENNPLLRAALAQSAGVSARMDLVSAAKAAAVVETLDAVAFGASAEMLDARDAILSSPEELAEDDTLSKEDRQYFLELRQRHADLASGFDQGTLTPFQLRQALVDYYSRSGQRELDRRFFSAADEQ